MLLPSTVPGLAPVEQQLGVGADWVGTASPARGGIGSTGRVKGLGLGLGHLRGVRQDGHPLQAASCSAAAYAWAMCSGSGRLPPAREGGCSQPGSASAHRGWSLTAGLLGSTIRVPGSFGVGGVCVCICLCIRRGWGEGCVHMHVWGVWGEGGVHVRACMLVSLSQISFTIM